MAYGIFYDLNHLFESSTFYRQSFESILFGSERNSMSPNEALASLRVGEISPDRTTIVGRDSFLFLFEGTNSYYHQYFSSNNAQKGVQWAELSSERYQRFSGTPFLSIFVPNKATCLYDLYPIKLSYDSTPAWQNFRIHTAGDDGVMFSDALFSSSKVGGKELPAWRMVDSHWSEYGCLTTANEILERLGINKIQYVLQNIDTQSLVGDLSCKFDSLICLELTSQKININLPESKIIFDSGNGSVYGPNLGRRITRINPEAICDLHLLLVGNSFSGLGDFRTDLTYWLGLIFSKVTFLHSGCIPADALEFYRPDLIIFQGVEHFLTQVPSDNLKADEIELIYTKHL